MPELWIPNTSVIMRAILDVETNSAEEFGAVMQELKKVNFVGKSNLSLISSANHFEDDRTLNVLTDEEVDTFNRRICRAE
jgi:hypothetical protein